MSPRLCMENAKINGHLGRSRSRWILDIMGACGKNSCHLESEGMPGCCESCNEPSRFTKWWGTDFLRGISGKMLVTRNWFAT
jgi:hypothetical protein